MKRFNMRNDGRDKIRTEWVVVSKQSTQCNFNMNVLIVASCVSRNLMCCFC